VTPEWLALWSVAFVETILVETPIYTLMLALPMAGAWRPGLWRAALVSLGLQATTHPVLWLVWPLVAPHVDYAPLVVIAETCVVLAEGALVRWVLGPGTWARALLTSLVANATSTVFGLVTA